MSNLNIDARSLYNLEQGKLNLDTPFVDILTQHAVPASAYSRIRTVTLRRILHHTGAGGRGTPTLNCFRQEHQVGPFFSIFEELLARRAYLRTHGQPTR